jgi:hypothetical protein
MSLPPTWLLLLAGAACVAALTGGPRVCQAQDPNTEIAKQLQNPVADLASLPLQFNFRSAGDLGTQSQLVFNIQPVIPLQVSDNINVIWRTIVPYISTPLPSAGRVSGLGDIQTQLFFTPTKASALTWGIGPVLSIPTATNDLVRTGEWAIGPGVVLVKNVGAFVLGAVANNIWHFAGDDADPRINTLTVQPFVNYNLGRGWALAFAPLITANWSASSGDVWTLPLGLGISKVDMIGRQPVNLTMQYYHNVERPAGSGADEFRFAVAFVFPRVKAPAAPPT